MVSGGTLYVDGLQEWVTALDHAVPETKAVMRAELRGVGDIVKNSAVRRLSPVSPRSAMGYRTRVSRHSVVVVQSLKKSRNPISRRRNWGPYQMTRVLRPALVANEQKVAAAFEAAIGRVCDHLQGGR